MEDEIRTLSAEEYKMVIAELLGSGGVRIEKVKTSKADGSREQDVWGFELDEDSDTTPREIFQSSEIQTRLGIVSDDSAQDAATLADTLTERCGDAASSYEQMAVEDVDGMTQARRQGIAAGLRMAMAIAFEET